MAVFCIFKPRSPCRSLRLGEVIGWCFGLARLAARISLARLLPVPWPVRASARWLDSARSLAACFLISIPFRVRLATLALALPPLLLFPLSFEL